MKLRFSKVDLVLLCMVIFWGANISVIKLALTDFHPVVFNCLRFTLATLTMLFLYRDVLRVPPSGKALISLIILGILGNTCYQFLFIYGVKLSYVSNVSILLGTTPIFTTALASFLKIENVRSRLWIGILLSFCGIVFIELGSKDFHAGNFSTNIGDVFVIVASFAWSLYTAFSKKLVNAYSSRHYVLYTVLTGTLVMIPISLPYFRHQDWSHVRFYSWMAVFYSAMLALVFGYSAWYYGVQKIGSTRTSVYSNLTPVAGLLIGMIFLGERLTGLQWIGAIIIFTGLMLNRFAKGSIMEPELNPGIVSTQ
jgi:drug/metabolite transporter (DMT)-like permease